MHTQTTQQPWVLTLDERIALGTNPGIALTHFSGQTQLLRSGLMLEVKRLDLPANVRERLRSVSKIYMADSFAEGDLHQDELALKHIEAGWPPN